MELKRKLRITNKETEREFRDFNRDYLFGEYRGRGGFDRFCDDVERQLGVRPIYRTTPSQRKYLTNIEPIAAVDDAYTDFLAKWRAKGFIDPDNLSLHRDFLEIVVVMIANDKNFEDDDERARRAKSMGIADIWKHRDGALHRFDYWYEALNDTAANPQWKSITAVIYVFYLRPTLAYVPLPAKAKRPLWLLHQYVHHNIERVFLRP